MGRVIIRILLMIAAVFALWAYSPADDSPAPATVSIEIVEPLRGHEGPPGRSRIRLSRVGEEEPLFDETIEGIWEELGWSERNNAYLLGGMFADGGFLPVRRLALLSADSGQMTSLMFDGNWSALAGILGPEGRYWAFVGYSVNDRGEEIAPFGLFCLSLQEERVIRLGDAPASVPEEPPERTEDVDDEFYWGWGAYCCDGYFRPDPRVMHFPRPHVLSVDYGYDPLRKGQRRRVVDFDLSKEFGGEEGKDEAGVSHPCDT